MPVNVKLVKEMSSRADDSLSDERIRLSAKPALERPRKPGVHEVLPRLNDLFIVLCLNEPFCYSDCLIICHLPAPVKKIWREV